MFVYVPSARTRPSLSLRTTVIFAFSPGMYVALSVVIETDAGVVEPTRTETAVALTPVVAVADAFVPTVMFAVPALTPSSEHRYQASSALYAPQDDEYELLMIVVSLEVT